MKKSARIAGLLFVTLSLMEVTALCLGIEAVHPWIKPLLIPSLAAAALLALLPEHRGAQTVLLAAGLALHTAGDLLLLFDDRGFIWFAAGLGAFLAGHFCYLAVLLHGIGGLRGWKEILCWAVPPALAIPVVFFFDVTGALRIVLAVYALTLFYVAASGAIWRLRGRKLGWRVLAGGLTFIASDALLALNAFNGVSFPLRHALVIATYLLAEWLLVSAMVRHRLQE